MEASLAIVTANGDWLEKNVTLTHKPDILRATEPDISFARYKRNSIALTMLADIGSIVGLENVFYFTLGIATTVLHLLRRSMINQQTVLLPALKRMMVFIDGENLVSRYQSMLANGRLAENGVEHEVDVYAWIWHAVFPDLHVVQRATYYTYCTGSPDNIAIFSAKIKAMRFRNYAPTPYPHPLDLNENLYPRVFHKQKHRPGKGVDIQMSVDILCNTYQDNLDTVYIVSGDGDYMPLISECQRMGKQVYVAALSSGLNSSLPLMADRFFDLDRNFFAPVPDAS